MIKEYLQAIEGIEIYPVIGLILFLAIFLFIIFWVLKIDKSYLTHMKQLPLDSETDAFSNQAVEFQNFKGDKNEL